MADNKPAQKTNSPATQSGTPGQIRTEQRLRGETENAKGDTVLLKTTTGKTLEVTDARWKAEGQTLRQQGFERADLVPDPAEAAE